ncbi:hypothetical protein LO772_30830 [Yinghuangia sp. ASG 101]|uniref:hypothetical protein n=1 Tax=Yinghuangia sp. ASG 101 TaxID=2896848 RepID=UPI001E4A08D2|nr:hypothetical protein [Yinghuangia sp. ASG 101]UGQ11153.1 hypothetical protein LO772_30830 [Yinghuangia sp. ASG 101]
MVAVAGAEVPAVGEIDVALGAAERLVTSLAEAFDADERLPVAERAADARRLSRA